MHHPTIVVIGAGFTGTMTALALQDHAPPDARIHLLDPTGTFGPGLAHAATQGGNLLNVPAERMSAYPDAPQDFVQWLAESGAPVHGPFVPRRLYGAYLADRLQTGAQRQGAARIHLCHDAAGSVASRPDGLDVRCTSGRDIAADAVVLATGNLPPLPPFDATALQAAGLWRADAWCPESLAGCDPDEPVLLIGTGLTTADAAIALLDAGHRGPVLALSRRGLLPRPHLSHHAAPATLPQPLPSGLNALTRLIRAEARRAVANGEPWQPVIDALRPATQALWQGLTHAEKTRFMRHLRGWWDVFRHRMPPQAADRLQDALRSGQLRLHPGRVLAASVENGIARIDYRPRGKARTATLHAARVVNCTGPAGDLARTPDPLLRALFASGIARTDALGIGLDVAQDGAVLGPASERLFAAGPLTKGRFWEITAVPDIRKQCQQVARTVAASLTRQTALAAE
jgi:hypothetical protein